MESRSDILIYVTRLDRIWDLSAFKVFRLSLNSTQAQPCACQDMATPAPQGPIRTSASRSRTPYPLRSVLNGPGLLSLQICPYCSEWASLHSRCLAPYINKIQGMI